MAITNEEYLSGMIMERAWHKLLCGANGQAREELLKRVVVRYPAVANQNRPMGIYINDPGLQKVDLRESALNKATVISFHERYYEFLLAYYLISSACSAKESIPDSRQEQFIKRINNLYDKGNSSIKDLVGLRDMLNEAMLFFKKEYDLYIKSAELRKGMINEAPLTFIMLDSFLALTKELLNNNSHFGVIIDQQQPIPDRCQRAINNYIACRMAGDLTMMVACYPGEWTGYTIQGEIIENVHDYSTIDLDGSSREYVNKLALKNGLPEVE